MRVKYKIEVETEAKETATHGEHAYIVALCCGGLMEEPEIYYVDHQIIRAASEDEARRKYNELNHCSYFYGQVLGLIE